LLVNQTEVVAFNIPKTGGVNKMWSSRLAGTGMYTGTTPTSFSQTRQEEFGNVILGMNYAKPDTVNVVADWSAPDIQIFAVHCYNGTTDLTDQQVINYGTALKTKWT